MLITKILLPMDLDITLLVSSADIRLMDAALATAVQWL